MGSTRLLSLGILIGFDLLGFTAAPKTWVELGKAVQLSDAYASLGAWGSLLIMLICQSWKLWLDKTPAQQVT